VLDNAFDKKSAPHNVNGGKDATHDGVVHGNGKNDAGSQGNGAGKPLPLKGNYAPPEVENVDIFRLLDQLEELPEKAKHLPFNTLIGFDNEQFYYLVLKIRANLPDDMKKAQRVARDSERIVDEARDAAVQQLESGRVEAGKALEEARAEANRIVEEARQQAAAMADRSEVVRMATAQAHEMLRRAETEASEIRKGADDYARDVLANLEVVMSRAIVTVQRGRETLEKARG
jgi:vacuolar-type H+-ATPase subunit H